MSDRSLTLPTEPGPLTVPEDGRVLLDVPHDRFLKLNAVGSAMWARMQAGQADAEIVAQMAQQYGVDPQRVASDVQALRHRLAALGVDPTLGVVPPPSPPAKPNAPPSRASSAAPASGQTQGQPPGTGLPSVPFHVREETRASPAPTRAMVATALLGLAGFDLVLRVWSLKVLCACVARVAVRPRRPASDPRSDPTPDPRLVAQVCAAVERACVWYSKQALCLQRSAVTACLLRRFGVPARLVIGARPMPFLAHAWVEVEGAVVNDWPRTPQFYPTLTSY